MMTKFYASLTVINPDVDMDVELVRDMLSSPAGIQELYTTAQEAAGEVFIVDGDLGVANLIAAKLNDAYAEFLSNEAARVKGAAVQAAKQTVGTAFEGDSRVPVSASAEDEALANIEAGKSTKQQTKTTKKVETTMTNNTNLTQEQKNAQTAAAQAFLAAQGAKMQNAVKAPKKEVETTVAPESKKLTVKLPTQNKEEEVVNVARKGNVKASVKLNNTKEETTMNTTQTNGGRQSAGRSTTKAVDMSKVKTVDTNNRIEFDVVEEFKAVQWYLNDARYTFVERIEELVAFRKLEEAGIVDVKFRDPKAALRYVNDDVISVIEFTTAEKDGNKKRQLRIQKQTSSKSTADLKSSNIGWVTEDGSLRPVFQKWIKNEEQVVTATCACEAKVNVGLNESTKCACGKDIVCKVNEDSSVDVVMVEVDMVAALSGGDAVKRTELECFIGNYIAEIDEKVTADQLALLMAFAQYAHGLDMNGLVSEE